MLPVQVDPLEGREALALQVKVEYEVEMATQDQQVPQDALDPPGLVA